MVTEETIGKVLVNTFVWAIVMWIGNLPAFAIGIGITYFIWKDWRN